MGNFDEDYSEIGNVSALINEIKPDTEIVKEIWLQFNEVLHAPLK